MCLILSVCVNTCMHMLVLVCVPVNLYVCVSAYVCANAHCVCVQVHMCVCYNLSLTKNLPCRLGWLAYGPLGSTCLHL